MSHSKAENNSTSRSLPLPRVARFARFESHSDFACISRRPSTFFQIHRQVGRVLSENQQKAEKKNRPYTAQREYRKVKLNLEILPADLERAATATEVDLVRLQEIQSAVTADLERIQQLLDERELARPKED